MVAADALAQMIFSPLFGILADRLGQVRIVAMTCAATFLVGNVMYSLVSLVPEDAAGLHMPRLWFLLFTRFVVGVGTCMQFIVPAGRIKALPWTSILSSQRHREVVRVQGDHPGREDDAHRAHFALPVHGIHPRPPDPVRADADRRGRQESGPSHLVQPLHGHRVSNIKSYIMVEL